MKTWSLALTLGLALVVAGSPAFAAGDGMNIIRLGAQYVIPTGEYKDPMGATVSAKDAVGFAVQYERKVSDIFGMEVGFAYSKHDFEAKASGVNLKFAKATMTPWSIAGLFHVLKDKKVDFYLGPQLAWVDYGDLTLDAALGGGSEGLNTDFGYGAVFGLDIPFGSGKWALSTQVRYLETEAKEDIEDGISAEINPVAVQVAARIKF